MTYSGGARMRNGSGGGMEGDFFHFLLHLLLAPVREAAAETGGFEGAGAPIHPEGGAEFLPSTEPTEHGDILRCEVVCHGWSLAVAGGADKDT